MQIDLNVLTADPANVRQWFEYRDGFELLLSPAFASEQRAFYRSQSKRKHSASDEEKLAREFWLSHVQDWRGLEERDGTPIPFSEELLGKLWDRDASFSAWVLERSQSLDSFRVEAAAVAPVPLGIVPPTPDPAV